MSRRDLQRDERQRALTEALRGVRQVKGLRAQDVAIGMGLELRAYERFEAGEGRLDLNRIFLFGEVTDSDPLAIVNAVFLAHPELAAQCADNKLLLVQAIALERLSKALGDTLRQLDAATLIDAFEQVFDRLRELQESRNARALEWLAREKPTSE